MRRTKAPHLLWLVAAVALSCGGTTERATDSSWLHKPAVQVLKLRWAKSLAPSLPNFMIPEMVEEHDRFEPIETSSAGYDLDRRRAFIGSSVGGLYCLGIEFGETVWRFDLDHPVGSTPVFDEDRKYVYFGADDGKLYAVHARSGRLIWSFDTGSEIRRSGLLYQDTLYIGNAGGILMAVNPDNGEVVWQYRRQPIEGFVSAGYAGVGISGSNLITSFDDGVVVSVDASAGTEVWSSDLAREVSRDSNDQSVQLVDCDATPVVVGDVVVAASVAGGVYGLDADSGAVLWTRPDVDHVTGLASREGTVFASRSGVGLAAIDPSSGRILWSKSFQAGVLQDPVVYDDTLLVADSEMGLHVVSVGTGDLLQRIDQREGFFARPSLHGGYLLILGNRGVLYAMAVN